MVNVSDFSNDSAWEYVFTWNILVALKKNLSSELSKKKEKTMDKQVG